MILVSQVEEELQRLKTYDQRINCGGKENDKNDNNDNMT